MARELEEALAIPKPALSHLYPSTHRRRCPLHEKHPLVQVGRGGNGGELELSKVVPQATVGAPQGCDNNACGKGSVVVESSRR
jgi:hypothetical protein